MFHIIRAGMILLLLLPFLGHAESSTPRIVENELFFQESPSHFPSKNPLLRSKDNQGLTSSQIGIIGIKKEFLKKPYLLKVAMKFITNIPTVDFLMPKVIYFQENGHKVALFEILPYQHYNSIPGHKLIQTFPIIKKEKGIIYFDFSLGLKQLPFLKTASFTMDYPFFLPYNLTTEEVYAKVSDSFLTNFQVLHNNLSFNQISNIHLNVLGPSSFIPLDLVDDITNRYIRLDNQNLTIDLHIDITPTKLSAPPTFSPRILKDLNHVGYFEVPKIRTWDDYLEIDSLIKRWDISPSRGPIQVALTKNTPPKVALAISEGVDYWNRVFQKATGIRPLKLVTNASSSLMKLPRTIIFQWIDWPSAASAYGVSQSHPLTGEILHGYIYLPSSFIGSDYYYNLDKSLYSIDQYIRHIFPAFIPNDYLKNKNRRSHLFSLSPDHFSKAPHCRVHKKDSLKYLPAIFDSLNKQGHNRSDDAIIDKVNADNLRLVAAHELGHVLGLRHNFAANMGSKINNEKENFQKLWERYLKTGVGAPIFSSVMDYELARDELLIGSYIKTHVLDYDVLAIKWGYAKQKDRPPLQTLPLFCTDIDARTQQIFGCGVRDSGKNPFLGIARTLRYRLNYFAPMIVNNMLYSMFEDSDTSTMPLSQIANDFRASYLAYYYAQPTKKFFEWLNPGTASLKVSKDFHTSSYNPYASYDDSVDQELIQNLKEAGGLAGLLEQIFYGDNELQQLNQEEEGINHSIPSSTSLVEQSLNKLLKDERLKKGQTLFGTSYEMTAEKYTEFQTWALKMGRSVENYFLEHVFNFLTGTDPALYNHIGASDLPALLTKMSAPAYYRSFMTQVEDEEKLSRILKNIVTASDEEKKIVINGMEFNVSWPRYSLGVRVSALGLMDDNLFQKEGWLYDLQDELIQETWNRIWNTYLPTQSLLSYPKSLFYRFMGWLPDIDSLELDEKALAWFNEQLTIYSALDSIDSLWGQFFYRIRTFILGNVNLKQNGITIKYLQEKKYRLE